MTPRQQMGMLFLGTVALMLVLFFVQRSAINEAFMDAAGRCGPNLGVCPGWPGTDSRCINGYCKSDMPPELPALSDLPIRPERYTDPRPLQQKAAL